MYFNITRKIASTCPANAGDLHNSENFYSVKITKRALLSARQTMLSNYHRMIRNDGEHKTCLLENKNNFM